MLADGEAEDVGLAGEGEAVAVGEEERIRIVGLCELYGAFCGRTYIAVL